jgi:hypothetical protein
MLWLFYNTIFMVAPFTWIQSISTAFYKIFSGWLLHERVNVLWHFRDGSVPETLENFQALRWLPKKILLNSVTVKASWHINFNSTNFWLYKKNWAKKKSFIVIHIIMFTTLFPHKRKEETHGHIHICKMNAPCITAYT